MSDTTGSHLPAEVPWSGAQSGLGLSPDPHALAGMSTKQIPDRPSFAKANDARFDHGVIAEGQINGEVNPKGNVPWL